MQANSGARVTQSSGRYAPVALFAYKRPEHLQAAVLALHRNPAFAESPVYIFCDGPSQPADAPAIQKTREVARILAPPNTRFIFRDQNLGLRRSISEGVTQLTSEYGRVIVVEDDLVVSDQFLDFMNAGLDRYANDENVLQVSGHMFPVELTASNEALFLPFTTTWGWATWARAWKHFDASGSGHVHIRRDHELRKRFDLGGAYPYSTMLERQLDGGIDSWGILWYLSVFMREGLVLYPRQSLVANEGFDGTGTNCSASSGVSGQKTGWLPANDLRFPDTLATDEPTFAAIKLHLATSSSLRRRIMRRAVGYFTRGGISFSD